MDYYLLCPGKTAPRLLYDAIRFDPCKTIKDYNVLTDSPIPGDLHASPDEQVHHKACRHDFCTNLLQSNLPPQDSRAEKAAEYELLALCRKCRIHLDLGINYNAYGERPCPNSDYPLHHFVYKGVLGPTDFAFDCSSPGCGATLRFQYSQPEITDADIELLVDPDKVRRRYDQAVGRDSTRHGFLLATPVQTLWKLRRYIRDALKPDGVGKKIPKANKRFLESFGEDCADLLTRLGFKYIVSNVFRTRTASVLLTIARTTERKLLGFCHKLVHTMKPI